MPIRRRPRSPRRRGCSLRAATCWSSISPPTTARNCARRDAHIRLGFDDDGDGRLVRRRRAWSVDHVEHLKGGELTVTLWRGVEDRRCCASGGRHERLRAASTATSRCSPKRAATSRSASNSSRPRPTRWRETLWALDPDPRAAPAALRLGHLWRGRLDPRAHPRDGRADPQGNRADAGRAPDLRRRDARGSRRDRARLLGRSAFATSSRCAATRRSPARAIAPHPGGYANAAELVAGLKAIAPFDISVAAYPEIHPDSAIAARPISIISSARSMPAPTARSPNSSSRPTASSASRTKSRRPEWTSRSCRESCRSRTSPRPAASPQTCGAAHPRLARPAVRGSRRSCRRRAS